MNIYCHLSINIFISLFSSKDPADFYSGGEINRIFVFFYTDLIKILIPPTEFE